MPRVISIVAATLPGLAIGYKGNLLYRLPNDMERFKSLTTGNIVIMGNNTYKSIGKALPNRVNVVISRTQMVDTDVLFRTNVAEAIEEMQYKYPNKDVYIIGGAQIYREAMTCVDEILITYISRGQVEADTFFPAFPTPQRIIKDTDYREDEGCSYFRLMFDRDAPESVGIF